MKIDGIARTEIDQAVWNGSLSGQSTFFNLFGSLYICRGQDDYATLPGAELILANDPSHCMSSNQVGRVAMPVVNFVTNPLALGLTIPVASLEELDPAVLDVKLLSTSIDDCSMGSWPNFIQDSDGTFYVEDRRVLFLDLTDTKTVSGRDLAGKTCPTAPRTFLNEESCTVRSDCSPPVYSSGSFVLNAEAIRTFYDVGGHYIYRISGLPVITDPSSRYENFSPCNDHTSYKRFDWTPFRFVRKDTCFSVVADSNIQSTLSSILASELIALSTTEREAKRVLDVAVDKNACLDPFKLARGGSINVNVGGVTTCWTHSHPDEWSVFNFDTWTLFHPGNLEAYLKDKKNPIAAFAETDSALEDQITLDMPGWHPDSRFDDSQRLFERLGNYGDSVSFNDLPPSAKNADVTAALGGVEDINAVAEYVQVCASPGEVSNTPRLGHQYRLQKGKHFPHAVVLIRLYG